MPNAIKYSTGSETQALKKGNFYIATGDVDKGPTSSSSYWNGISPPLSGYTIYLNKASNGPSIYVADNDAQLITLTNQIAGTSYITANECLSYFAGQTDKIVLNKDVDGLITNGLVLFCDFGFTSSYPTTGTTVYDLSVNATNGTLTNGPTFNSSNYGSLLFDGVDDYVYFGNPSSLRFSTPNFSYGCWFYWTNTNTLATLMGKRDGANTINVPGGSSYNQYGLTISDTMCCGPAGKNLGNCIISDGGSSFSCSLSAPLPNYEGWLYGFITIDTNSQKVFINGKVSGTTSNNLTNTTFNIVGRSFYIGCTGGETEGTIIGPFNNKIRLAHVYNRTLSESEVLQNYLSTINPMFIFGSNLKIWYDMSIASATDTVLTVNTIDTTNNITTLSRVVDLSGNGKHLVQNTKINQPTFIPNSQNGKPANYNTGGNWYDADATVMYSPSPGLTTGARSFFIVLKGSPTSVFSWDRDSAWAGSLQIGYAGINGWNDLQQDIGVIGIGGGNSTDTYIMSYLFDTTQTLMYRNGNLNRTQNSNTFTLNGNSFGCWTTFPSAGNQEGYWYEMIFLNKIPTVSEYNTLVTYLGNKWGVSYGLITNYN